MDNKLIPCGLVKCLQKPRNCTMTDLLLRFV